MPALTAQQEDITVDSREDVDDLLEEMFDIKREIVQRESEIEKETKPIQEQIQELEARIEKIEDKHDDYLDRRREALDRRRSAIEDFATSHTNEVLNGVSGRTYSNAFGSVSYQKVPFNFEWVDKDQVVESLRALGHEDLLRVETKVPYKSTLKDLPELVRRLDGVEPQEEHDEVDVELNIG